MPIAEPQAPGQSAAPGSTQMIGMPVADWQMLQKYFGPYWDQARPLLQGFASAAQPDWGSFLDLFSGQSSNARRQAGLAQARIGLARQGLGIDKAALLRQLPLLRSGYQMSLQELAQQASQARYGAQRQWQQISGESAARGANTTEGRRRMDTDVGTQLRGSLATLGRRRSAETLEYREAVSDIRDRLKHLGLRGKELGLQAAGIAASLQSSLDQIGLSQFFTINDLMKAFPGGGMQQLQQLAGLIQLAQQTQH